MQVSLEETLIAWNSAAQEDLKEIVRLWELVQEMKKYGHGSIELIVQDGKVVFASSTKKWRNQGQVFADCTL